MAAGSKNGSGTKKTGTSRRSGAIGRGLKDMLKHHKTNSSDAQIPSAPVVSGPELPGFRIEIVSVGLIEANPDQPRKKMDDESIEILAESIKQHGLINPLTVRRHPDPAKEGRYLLIAGERRLRASRLAGLTQVPVIIQETDEVTAYEKALVENIQREDLDPMEEAEAYQYLLKVAGYTHEDVARRVGRSRSAITNKLRLLGLPAPIRQLISEGELTEGHGRALLMVPSEEEMLKLDELAVERSLSVREVERLARKAAQAGEEDPSRGKPQPPAYFPSLQRRLQERLGTKVRLKPRKRGGGTISIDFYDEDQLQRLLELVGIGMEEEE